jgi:nucleoside-diphosphate-sugar epimerase
MGSHCKRVKMDKTIKRVLVTGGAGFIGSHLVDALLDRGCQVVVVDNLSTGKRSNLAHIEDRILFREGDIQDLETMKETAEGCDAIFHQAAVVSVPQTVADPIHSAAVNDMGTLMVLEAARTQGVKRVVLASSCAVYGDDPEIPKREGMLLRPQSPYAVQKLTNELNARLYAELYGLDTVCLRYFNVFGPRQDPSSPYSGVISIFMTRAVDKKTPTIYGDGRQYRDFIYVKDVVTANLLAIAARDASGEVFNIGTGQTVRISQLWNAVSDLAAAAMPPVFEKSRPGDILESVADIQKAASLLSFTPQYKYQEGLEKTFEWFRGGKDNGVSI